MIQYGLGTAQFGNDYGVSNKNGPVSKSRAFKILDLAQHNGFEFIDTAKEYGESEQIIGNFLESAAHQFKVITKIPPQDILNSEKLLLESLEKLKTDKLYALMLHSAQNLEKKHYQSLEKLQSNGLVEKLGVTIYDPSDYERLFDNCDFNLVQLPHNIFDQRFLEQGILKKLKSQNVELHARSIFLQGLLLEPAIQEKPYFKTYSPLFLALKAACAELSCSPLELCLAFQEESQYIDCAIVGVTSHEELNQIIQAKGKTFHFDYSQLSCRESKIIDPRHWTL